MAERRDFGVLAGGHEVKRPLRNLGVDKIILKWIFKKWPGLVWLRIGTTDCHL